MALTARLRLTARCRLLRRQRSLANRSTQFPCDDVILDQVTLAQCTQSLVVKPCRRLASKGIPSESLAEVARRSR